MTVDTRRKIAKWVFVLVFAVIVWYVVNMVTGCASTVIPKKVKAQAIPFNGNDRNGGLLKAWPGKGGLITEDKKAEYDALVGYYAKGASGHPMLPPLKTGAGLTALRGKDNGFPLYETVWLIDAQHLALLGMLAGWKREGRLPWE